MSCERDPAVRAALLDKRVAKTKGTCSFFAYRFGHVLCSMGLLASFKLKKHFLKKNLNKSLHLPKGSHILAPSIGTSIKLASHASTARMAE